MKRILGKSLATCGVLTCIAAPAVAEINFNGFASMRATAADSDFGTSPYGRFKGNGDISFKDDSLFALQASADLTEGLSATVQLVADGRKDFNVEAQWAYLKYEFDDSHSLSAGRLVNPIFSQSQYEKVGYAHNFGRLPKVVYQDFDFATIEGLSLDSIYVLGDLTLDTKFSYGNWNGEIFSTVLDENVSIGIKDLISANFTLSGDWWKIFVGAFNTELEGGAGSIDEIYAGFIQGAVASTEAQLGFDIATSEEVSALISAAATDGNRITYLFTGFAIDVNNFLVDFEYVDYGSDDYLATLAEGWYLSLGYRFDKSVFTVHQENYDLSASRGFLSDIDNTVLVGIGTALSENFATGDIDATGITWRYDFHPSAALKIDYLAGENGQSDIGDFTIWSIGVDLVF